MKTTKLLTLIAIVILAVSCKKNNGNGPNGTTGQEILTMKVDGVDWVGDDNLAGFILTTNNSANITGNKVTTDESFLITYPDFAGIGTYTFNPTLSQYVSFMKDGASPKIYQVKAAIPKSRFSYTISKINNGVGFPQIEGTFSGVLYANATDSVVITNGVFKFN